MKKSLILMSFVQIYLFLNIGFAEEIQINSQKEKFSFALKYSYVSFNISENFDFPSGIYEIHAGVPLNDNWSVIIIIPSSIYSFNDNVNSTIGNLTAGIKYDNEKKNPLLFKGLISLPTISKENRIISTISAADVWNIPLHIWGGLSADLEIEKRYSYDNGFYTAIGLGNYLLIPVGEGLSGSFKNYLKYFFKGAYEKMNSFGFDASIRGIFLLTENSSFENKFLHMLNVGISRKSEVFNPRLFVTIPIGDNYSEAIKSIIGVEIKVSIKQK